MVRSKCCFATTFFWALGRTNNTQQQGSGAVVKMAGIDIDVGKLSRFAVVIGAGVVPVMLGCKLRQYWFPPGAEEQPTSKLRQYWFPRAAPTAEETPTSKSLPPSTEQQQQQQTTISLPALPGPLVLLCVHEALAHVSFFLTGHRGLVQTGTWLKVFMDSKDVFTHGGLGVASPEFALTVAHMALFGWHTAKATDSVIISGYSPMRGLYYPNLLDAGIYTVSAILGARQQPGWAVGGVALYISLRTLDRIY
jgi:hypothetical protein